MRAEEDSHFVQSIAGICKQTKTEKNIYMQLFRERLSEKSTKVHATIAKGSLGHNEYSFHKRTDSMITNSTCECIMKLLFWFFEMFCMRLPHQAF